MKKLSSILMIALAALAFQACKNKAKDSTDAADSTNKAKDTTTNVAATGGIAVDENDAKFVTTAAADGMAEVNAANMALQKSTNAGVKKFASMMVTDHTKAGDGLAAIAKTKNVTLPTTPTDEQKKMADDMAKMSGKDFDKDYVNAMVDGHEKAVKLFTDASQNCKDAELKDFATKTLPTLKMHLDSIKALKASMK